MSDVFLVRQPIAEGKTEVAQELFSELTQEPEIVMEVLQAETVYTESAFLEETDNGDAILYYIEAEDDATVLDVFEELMENPGAEGEELGELVAAFQSIVAGEPERVDCELLYHVVNPNRPQ